MVVNHLTGEYFGERITGSVFNPQCVEKPVSGFVRPLGRSCMTWKRRDPFQIQLDLELEVEPERSKPTGGGRQLSGGGSWLRRYSVLEPVPGRVPWSDGRVVRDDERRRGSLVTVQRIRPLHAGRSGAV